MGIVFVIGFPLGVFVLLFRRRHKLHGDSSDPYVATTQSKYGFLYLSYGPSAWWWEVEELVRKLLLSAVVVLLQSGSPLQVVRSALQLLCDYRRCLARSVGAGLSRSCLTRH